MQRIAYLCACLDKCSVFADVACDHGYFAEYMLKNNLCERAVVSDISPKCLKKAQELLKNYIAEGKCDAVCRDGLENISSADQVIIAGIGGEEIVRILKSAYIPEKFVFQPMKNAESLRGYLINNGCGIVKDDLFFDGKNYYFVIKGVKRGKENYGKAQLLFGKDSIKNPVLKDLLSIELQKKQNYLLNDMSKENRAKIQLDINFLQGVYRGDIT